MSIKIVEISIVTLKYVKLPNTEILPSPLCNWEIQQWVEDARNVARNLESKCTTNKNLSKYVKFLNCQKMFVMQHNTV